MKMKKAERAAVLAAIAAAAFFFAVGCATQEVVPDSSRADDAETLRISQQLAGKTWILSGILFDGVFIPMEPAHSAGNVLVFNRDGTFRTTAAALVMSGTWMLAAPDREGDGAQPNAAIAMAHTSLAGEKEEDPAAAKFQATYLSAFERASALTAYGNSFMLFDSEGRHILSFILNNPDW